MTFGAPPAAFAASARAAAWMSAPLTVWGGASLLALPLAFAPAQALLLTLAGVALALALALAFALARRPRAAAAPLAFAGALAVAGHVVAHPALAPLLPWAAAPLVLLAPLVAGWRVRALDLAVASTGRRPRFLPLRALTARAPDDITSREGPTQPAWRGLLLAWGVGLALPALALADLALPRRGARLHLAADVDALAPHAPAGVALRAGVVAFPVCGSVLDVRGPRDAVRAFVHALETEHLRHVTIARSAHGRRLEARANALLREAEQASTLEERSVLLDEAQRLERILDARELPPEERVALRAWKAQRARVVLSAKLLGEPVGARQEGRVLSPGPALAPDLAHLLDAGGLALARKLVFVPHWVVPIETPWGEREAVVDATEQRCVDDARGDALLRADRDGGGAHHVLAVPRSAQFPVAPEPTNALLRELREAHANADVARATPEAADILLVPCVPTPTGLVDVVTGMPTRVAVAPPPRPAADARAPPAS